jgi:hypothetical protein
MKTMRAAAQLWLAQNPNNVSSPPPVSILPREVGTNVTSSSDVKHEIEDFDFESSISLGRDEMLWEQNFSFFQPDVLDDNGKNGLTTPDNHQRIAS